MTTNTDSIARELDLQLEWLDAVKVSETRYALPYEGYPAESGWYTFSRDAALKALAQANKEGQDDFTARLNGSNTTEMPEWWEPEHRTHWYCDTCGRTTGYVMKHLTSDGHALRKITASLETGAEEPC